MIFCANVMNARPVKEIMRKTGLTKNRVYSLRMGCTFHMDYELLFALQRMGYEVRVVGRGPAEEQSAVVGRTSAPVGQTPRGMPQAKRSNVSRRAPGFLPLGTRRGAAVTGTQRPASAVSRARSEMEPNGDKRRASAGPAVERNERTPADPAGNMRGATFEQSENGG